MWEFLADNPGYGFLGFVMMMSITWTLYAIFRKPTEAMVNGKADQMKAEADLNRSRLEFLEYVKTNREDLRGAVRDFKSDALELDRARSRHSKGYSSTSWLDDD